MRQRLSLIATGALLVIGALVLIALGRDSLSRLRQRLAGIMEQWHALTIDRLDRLKVRHEELAEENLAQVDLLRYKQREIEAKRVKAQLTTQGLSHEEIIRQLRDRGF